MLSKEEIEKIEVKKKEWEEKFLSKFVEKGETKEKFETPSGIPLKHVYSPDDIK